MTLTIKIPSKMIKNFINKPRRILSFLPYISSLVLVGIPITLIQRDFWDGVVIRYAADSGNLDGAREMLTTSGWEIQFYLVQIELLISKIRGMSFHSINVILILISLLLIIYVLCRCHQ